MTPFDDMRSAARHARSRARAIARVGAVVLVLVACLMAPSHAAATADPVAVGTILPWGGPSTPAGYLVANGSAVNRATYAALFAVIGTTWGAGDGSTTFNLPDLRQRFPIGQAAAGTASTLGGTGGAIDHAPALAAHAHSVSMDNAHTHLGAHTHQAVAPLGLISGNVTLIDPYDPALDSVGSTDYDSTRSSFSGLYPYTINATGGAERWYMTSTAGDQPTSSAGAHDHGGSTGSAGAATSAANPPFLAVRYLVKAVAGSAAPCGATWFTAQAAPSGNLLAANGAAVSRAAEPALFACAATTWGPGDGSTTFNVPDLRQRFGLGVAAAGTGATLGGAGGTIDHVHTVAAHTHGISTDGAHTHTWTHTHGFSNGLGISSNNLGVPSPQNAMHSTPGVGSWSYDSILPMNTYNGIAPNIGSGWLESWRVTTSSASPAVSTAGAHDHGGATASATPTTSSSNPPFMALQPFVARDSGDLPGAGAVTAFAAASVPAGWLTADGSAVSRATYAKLFAALGTAYGAGDGSTTFNLPDLRGRQVLGRASSGTGSTLGGTGGAIDHVHTAAHSHAIATGGAHTHSVAAHTHKFMSPVAKAGSSNLAMIYPADAAMSIHGSTAFSSVETTVNMYCCTTPVTNGIIEVFSITASSSSDTLPQAANHDHGGATGTTTPSTAAANAPFAAVRYLVRLNSAPLVSALTSPAAAAVTTDTTPDLTATFLDPDPAGAESGQLEFQACSDAACTSVVRSGTSSAGLAVGASGTWTVAGALPIGGYFWRVRGVDNEAEPGAWSPTRALRIDTAPAVPQVVTPQDLSATPTTTPDLVVTYADPDADSGTVDVQVCTTSGCGSVIASGSSGSAASGANATWTVTPALTTGTQVWWRARAVDVWGVQSAWSVTWRLDIDSSITITVDAAVVGLGTTVPGTDATATSTVTVGTTDPQGYTLHVQDESDGTALTCSCGGSVADWTGTDASPTSWAAGVAAGFGLTVLDAPAGRLAKWGAGTGTAAADFVNNRYAAVKSTSLVTLHTTAAASGGAAVVVGWRSNAAGTTPPGSYSGRFQFSALGNP